MSLAFQNIDPHPPLRPASVWFDPPLLFRGGGGGGPTARGRGGGGGGIVFEDARTCRARVR